MNDLIQLLDGFYMQHYKIIDGVLLPSDWYVRVIEETWRNIGGPSYDADGRIKIATQMGWVTIRATYTNDPILISQAHQLRVVCTRTT
jgi:hypothetical protein